MAETNISTKYEQELIKFLKLLGFKNVNGGSSFHMGERQVDACGGRSSTLLIVECTTQKDINTKIDSFRGKSNQIIKAFKQDETYKKYEKHRLILAVKDQEVKEVHLERAQAAKPEVIIWDDAIIKYYRSLEESIPDFAIFSLLAELDVLPDAVETTTFPAFKLSLGSKKKYELYMFATDARDFMKYAYVARREIGGESYYQRMVKNSRLNVLAEYINKGMIFPNNIVVALKKGTWKFNELSTFEEAQDGVPNWQTAGLLTLTNDFNTCWIIDGQHRLYSHAHSPKTGRILVSAFANITEKEQAKYFLDINREAKKVDSDLLWDLLGSISPSTTEGIISNAVKNLRIRGVFKGKIHIPSLGSGPYSLNNMATTIKDEDLAARELGTRYKKENNPLFREDYTECSIRIASGLNQFFTVLDSLLDYKTKKRLFTNGFIAVLISLYRLCIAHKKKYPTKADLLEILEPLAEYLNKVDDENAKRIRGSLSSGAGKLDLRNQFVRFLQENYDENFAVGLLKSEPTLADQINNLELELNTLVNTYMENTVGKDWLNNQKIVHQDMRKQIIERAQTSKKPPWEHLNIGYTVNNIVCSKEPWDDFFGELLKDRGINGKGDAKYYAKRLWEYRSNKIGHKHSGPVVYSKNEKALFESMYRMYKSVIDDGMEKFETE